MITEMLKNLLALPNSFWDDYAFHNELLTSKISPKRKKELIIETHKCGKGLADNILSTTPDITPSLLINLLNLNVNYINEPFSSEYVMFACFNKPNKVQIFNNTIEKAKSIIDTNNLNDLLCNVDIFDVLLSHEIYHYLEYKMPYIYTNQKLLTLWSFGKFKFKSNIICLNEIGAMTFTQELLNLPYSPYIFDLLFLYSQNEQMAKELYDNIINLSKKKEVVN